MQSVPSMHVATSTTQNYVEGGFIDLKLFHQTFAQEFTSQLEAAKSIDDIHVWAALAIPNFIAHAERRTSALRDTVVSMLANNNSSAFGAMISPPAYKTPTDGATHLFSFDPTSPRAQRVQSIDTAMDNPTSSSHNSMVRFQQLRDGGESLQGDDVSAATAGHNAANNAVSPTSMSRPGSFSNRLGSFARKHFNGIEVPMLKDDASGVVVDALNDTYSLASRGSYRRRPGGPSGGPHVGGFGIAGSGPASIMGAGGSVQPSHSFNNIKRRAYLSFVQLHGMPNLDIDFAAELRSRFSRPSKRHTDVFRDPSDLESLLDECGLPRIHDINSLEFNIFEEFRKYGDNAFTIVAMNVLLKYTFVSNFHFKVSALLTCVRTLQSFYRSENPFHNALHGADVLQTTHLYLCQRDVKENFSDLELFALLFAAMCIDVGHLGVNNQFLMKTRHPLATLYSDTSPMESMSCALAFCILDDPDCNFLQDSVIWDREAETEFRALVTDLILRSDDQEHASMSQDIDTILSRGLIGDDSVPQLLCAVLHAADVSYMCKPRHIYLEWAFRYMAENYRQGDAEAEYAEVYRSAHPDVPVDAETQWLRISKFCDRTVMPSTELQQSVMEHIVLPFVTLLQPFLPAQWADRLEANFRYLQEEAEEKRIVLENGVQEQLWKKGIATSWFDVPPDSGKNFLQVIRNWIATELPDDDGVSSPIMNVQQPSKLIGDQPQQHLLSATSSSSRPSNVSEASSNGRIAQDMLKVSKDGKKRLSVSQQAGATGPSTHATGLNAVHVLTGELLKHLHTLMHAGNPGSWDASRETAIFAQEWVKLLRTLEAQEHGPALLSTLSTLPHPHRTLSTGSHTSEESESISVIETLRDENSPFAHFRPGRLLSTASVGSADAARRESSNGDVLLSNAPFGCAVLLTQMWWMVYGVIDESVSNQGGDSKPLQTPVERPGFGDVDSDEELSVSQKEDNASPTMGSGIGGAAPPRSPRRASNEPRRQSHATTGGPPGGNNKGKNMTPPPPQHITPLGIVPSSSQSDGGPMSPQIPAPPNAIREMMAGSGRRPSSSMPATPQTGGGPVHGTGGVGSATGHRPSLSGPADPSPVRYVLQKRASLK